MLQKQLQLDGVSKQSCRGLNLALLWHSATDSLPVDAPWSKSVPPCLSVHQDEKNQMMTTNVWLKQVGLQIYEGFGFPTTTTYFKGGSRSNITACLVCLSVCPHLTGVERLQASLEAVRLRQRDIHQGAVRAHMGAGYRPLQQVRLIAFTRPHQWAGKLLSGWPD